MRAAVLICALSAAHAWKMPESMLEKPNERPKCVMPESFKRLPSLEKDEKGRASQRKVTELELKDKNFLAEPHLDTIYYINLEKSQDRSEHMLKQLEKTASGYKYQRFSANNRTDARLMEKSKYTVNKHKDPAAYSAGTMATYLSHWHVLEKISKHPDSSAVFLVLEDDAVLQGPWVEEVMCQVKQLPADWDVFKFGYWPLPGARWSGDRTCSGDKRQKLFNEYTCNQRSYALEWMGNVAYAVRPHGAKVALEHLHEVPLMDVDGAMMPGCCVSGSTTVPQNVYVSRFNLVKHGRFGSVRLTAKGPAKALQDYDTRTEEEEDGRESSFAARQRISQSFLNGDIKADEIEAEIEESMEKEI